MMSHIDASHSNRHTKRILPIGLVIGAGANAAGFLAGSVFFTASYGARFRGMEPESMFFVTVAVFAAVTGLALGLPAAVYDWFRGRWICGLIDCILAFTPIFTASLVSAVAAQSLGLTWD